ncbi:MFS transporter [Luminiphilus sp. nBUS_16]|uniref:MFS transporter n=1 Tax=Luminiphilus sp. nBUS_16 TaxID=3395315 RepID=UPI003EB880EC
MISLIWLSLVAALTSNIQPIFLGVLAESFSLSGSQLGFIGGAELGGSCLASVSAGYWFPRVRLRRAGLFAITVSVLGNLLTSEATDFSQLLLIRFTTGFLGTGVLYALTLGLFGQLKNADRIIAIAVVTHVLSLAVGMSTVPLLMERWQLPGVTVSLAILLSTAFLCLFLLPHQSRYETSKSATSESYNFLGAALLVSLIVFSIGLGSSWAFMERIGSSAGFAMGDIGNALAVSGLIGGFGALMAAVLGTRLGRVLPIVVALTLQVLTCLLLATRNDWYSYLVATALFNFNWNLTLPYLMGAISAADRSGRFMVLIPAAQTGGYALGPMLVGIFLVGDSFQLAAWVSMSAFIVCLAMIVPLLNRVSRINE